MTQRKRGTGAPVWIGEQSPDGTSALLGQEASKHEAFGGGKLWFGRHASDQDTLVFDPSETDPHGAVLALYSLTHHRSRSFPRATVLERIHPLTDDLGCARAKKQYLQRAALRTAHEETMAVARVERRSRQIENAIALHRDYIGAIGGVYEGVRETPPDHRPGRRVKCHKCGIELDDFAGTVCGICNGVLCSCGRCACKKANTSH